MWNWFQSLFKFKKKQCRSTLHRGDVTYFCVKNIHHLGHHLTYTNLEF